MRRFCLSGPILLRQAAIALAALASIVFAAPRLLAAEQRQPTDSTAVVQPMTFVRVVDASSACASNCPEWVAAEGKIVEGTAQAFTHFVASLGGRRLPILISSPGGSGVDAMAMGRLIRAQRMVVAVAHTKLSPCPTAAPNCSPVPGSATTFGAYCLSACPLVLAGGVERYANVFAPVGVHQLKLGMKTMVMRRYLVQYRIVDGKKEEISRSLTSQSQFTLSPDANDLAKADMGVANYLKQMGVGEPVMSLMLATPPASIRVISHSELVASRLTTMWTVEPPFTLSGAAAGLTGVPIGASAATAGVSAFAAQWPAPGLIDGRRALVDAEFQYRPGGGAIAVSFSLADQASAAGFARSGLGSYIFVGDRNPPLEFDEARPGFAASGSIGRGDFCRLRGSRRAFVEYAEPGFGQSDERRREHLARVDLATPPGAAALIAQACAGAVASAPR